MSAIIRKRTILFPRLVDSRTKKSIVIRRPKGVSEKNLRSQLDRVGRAARASGRAMRKALASE